MPAKTNSELSAEPTRAVEPPVASIPQTQEPASPVSSQLVNPPHGLTPGDERTWGILAHLSTLLNLVTGFGGPIAALIIYLIYKDHSRFVAYHALQSMVFQLIWWFGGGILIGLMWAVVGGLSMILVGIILIPFAVLFTFVLLLLPVGALIYGVVGAVQVNQGYDFKYWLVGDWVRGTLTGV
ncbi:MAG: DUF4870 domain-containing protein [Anaerolineales bacterium]